MNDKMIYFNEGHVVTVRHLENSPKMVVKRINKMLKPDDEGKFALIGITCYWFDNNGTFQEATFNTKDLKKEIEEDSLVQETIKVKPINKIARL